MHAIATTLSGLCSQARPGSVVTKARFPFKRNRLRCVRCVNENRKKRKRLQAANHGCHCFDRAFLLAGACVCCVKPTQALAFEWKPGLTYLMTVVQALDRQ